MGPTQWVLDLIVCPQCRAKVRLKADGSGLKCVACHRVYPIQDGIPDMLVSDAVLEPPEPPEPLGPPEPSES